MALKTWILLDNLIKIQSEELSTEQVQYALHNMPRSEYSRFLIWTDPWDQWITLENYLKSDQKFFPHHKLNSVPQMNSKPLPQVASHSPHTSTTAQNVSKTKQNVSAQSHENLTQISTADEVFNENPLKAKNRDHDFRRIKENLYERAERHQLKIEIICINSKNVSFRSFSENISMTGTLIEDQLPSDYLFEPFELVVVNKHATQNKNSRVLIKAKAIGEGQTRRIQFIDISESQKDKLLTLLNDYISSQLQIKKVI